MSLYQRQKLNAKGPQSQLKTFGPLLYMVNLTSPQTLKLLIYTVPCVHRPLIFALNDTRCYKMLFLLCKHRYKINH
ncbi:hypothetical protein GmHk_15G044047 [Glycine max]|nr:hypothetical protein GmHk_15G044047 [Glycine max]